MISVIISTFNRKKKLKRAVNSVLNQTFQDFELIVVDDCSTDGTRSYLREINRKHSNVRIILRDKNYGHDGRPKNEAIAIAKGKYVSFLDDDDMYYKEALSILYKYIVHMDADMVYGDYMNNRKGVKVPGWSIHFDVGMLSRANYISMCVVMVRRQSLLDVGGFNENVPKFKDWNMWIRLQKNGCSIAHVPIIVTEIGQDKDTISRRIKNKMSDDGKNLPTFFSVSDCKIYADKTVLGKAKKLKVAIFTLTLDRWDYTKIMAKSLSDTAGYDFDWFIIDQGSEALQSLSGDAKGKAKFLEDYFGKELKSISCLKENIGIAEGWNKAIEMIRESGGYDIVVKVDNDCQLMTNDWLKDMVGIFEINKQVVLSPYIEGLEETPGGVLRQTSDGSSPYLRINDKVVGVTAHLGGIVFAAPMELYKDFKFPTDLQGNKDYYLSKYAQQLGYSLLYMEEYRAWHIDGSSGQKEKYPDYFKKLYNN